MLLRATHEQLVVRALQLGVAGVRLVDLGPRELTRLTQLRALPLVRLLDGGLR